MNINLPPAVTAQETTTMEGGEKVPLDSLLKRMELALGLQTEAGRVALGYALKQVLIIDKKQLDYGPGNISKFGAQGVIVRMNDKMERLINLGGKKRRKAQNESIKDSFQDISNYGIIGQMCEDGTWPTHE